MNYIQKKFNVRYKYYYSLILLYFWSNSLSFLNAQTNEFEIIMIDTLEYTEFSLHEDDNMNYPASNLFDSKVNTCMVINSNYKKSPSLFIRIPDVYSDSIYLNIFSGYGKSERLYKMNSRPKEIKISLYSAFIPDGYVTESHYKCIAFQLPMQQTFYLSDTFGIQSLQLKYSVNDLKGHSKNLLKNYHSKHSNLLDTIMLVQLDVIDIWNGDKYIEDICISEIFFNDCYVSHIKKNDEVNIENIYLNSEENTLYRSNKQYSTEIYKDSGSVLQIMQQTNNKTWAIINALPREKIGRVESNYLIIDVLKNEVINQKLLNILPGYYPGEPMFLEEKYGKLFLVHESASSVIRKIELRHYYY